MACYAIGHIGVTDPDRYMEYAKAVLAQVQAVGGRVLAAGAAAQVEGPPLPNQNIVIEFPDEDTAMAWYRSDEYQAIKPVRLGASSSSQIALVQGWRGAETTVSH